VQPTPIPVVRDLRDGGHPRSDEPESALHSFILDSLDEDGALDVVSISLAGKSSEADVMVVASGRSTRHVASVADKLIERLKADAGIIPRAEGKEAADWVLVDAGDVIVHVFRPEVRDFYQLEKMWMAIPDATARPAAVR
jgi:ribosome-associated protein